ncbi:hypothetical protein BV25DRAFT_1918007 [Artomyces pyxidatus]|uniref:Uncharacterized protein n=1 Tax=Artomyces pyxidatus TaxID=48021 RepID=A0ACB8SUK9_9AGAM|nr:hypothetical protein BV25DRAFT_1918007 [Artomyces pyxidatus]
MTLPSGPEQAAFSAPLSWDSPPHPDATHHLIFNTVSSLLQRWPNTIYRNGHTIVPATIPAGTILYHSRANASVPTEPEWLAFDFEHSYIFCYMSCYVISLVATRDLRLAYFDGSSAAKMTDGPLDSQDLVIWDKAMPDRMYDERTRISDLCAWGKPLGLDGFVRMEFHFEVMLCDFSAGMQVVTLLNNLPVDLDPQGGRPMFHEAWFSGPGDTPGRQPGPPPRRRRPEPPAGWKGSLPTQSFRGIEVLIAGSWHNQSPGETRVRIDYSSIVSFYNPSLTSLVEARRGLSRPSHRLANISKSDLVSVQQELTEVFGRQVKGSGIDWRSITHVVIERYSERLELLQHLLHPSTYTNVTEQAAAVRIQILTMLAPYITTEAVHNSSDTSWVGSIVHYCSTTQTSLIADNVLTAQERLLRDAVEGTLREICRRLALTWVDAFDIEAATDRRKAEALGRWRVHVRELMEWLDWSIWKRCNPACGVDALCHVPTWPFFRFEPNDDLADMTPRCLSRVRPRERAT